MSKKKILIVDDDHDIVDILKALLETEGYDIIEAYDGKEGIDKAYQHMPHLILLDIMMPVMDGWQVCQRLKACKKTSNIPIAIITAKAEQEDRNRAKKEGADDYITKPFRPEDLILRIQKNLKGSEGSLRLTMIA
ncbi:response regulator [bacterium]|nr:response regulator [bacterium]MBU2461551.1 response regulator [bacterium]